MKFSIANVVLAALAAPLLASASAVPRTGGGGGGGSQPACSSGTTLQCCQQIQQPQDVNNGSLNGLLSLIGLVLGPVSVPVGVSCSPISVIALPGNSCSAQTACCQGAQMNGLINLGCNPINLNA